MALREVTQDFTLSLNNTAVKKAIQANNILTSIPKQHRIYFKNKELRKRTRV